MSFFFRLHVLCVLRRPLPASSTPGKRPAFEGEGAAEGQDRRGGRDGARNAAGGSASDLVRQSSALNRPAATTSSDMDPIDVDALDAVPQFSDGLLFTDDVSLLSSCCGYVSRLAVSIKRVLQYGTFLCA